MDDGAGARPRLLLLPSNLRHSTCYTTNSADGRHVNKRSNGLLIAVRRGRKGIQVYFNKMPKCLMHAVRAYRSGRWYGSQGMYETGNSECWNLNRNQLIGLSHKLINQSLSQSIIDRLSDSVMMLNFFCYVCCNYGQYKSGKESQKISYVQLSTVPTSSRGWKKQSWFWVLKVATSDM